jgi:hypothetical protein
MAIGLHGRRDSKLYFGIKRHCGERSKSQASSLKQIPSTKS